MSVQQTATLKSATAIKSSNAPKSVPKYTARDLAKDAGVRSAAIARRYLRAAKIQRPKEGWLWTDKVAARAAIETVQKAAKAAKAEPAK